LVAVEGKTTVTTEKHMVIPGLGNDMDRATDQADYRHFRLIPDAVAIITIVIEKYFSLIPVK